MSGDEQGQGGYFQFISTYDIDVQIQKAVTAYFSSEKLLLFGAERQSVWILQKWHGTC